MMQSANKRKGAVRGWLIGLVAVAVAAVALRMTVFKSGGLQYDIVWAAAESGRLVMTIETNGTVEPLSTVLVGCETTGKIIEQPVDNDDPVKKDQVICRIDPELVQAQHEQSIAELSRAEAALVEAKLARDEQKANLPVSTAQALAQLQDAEAALVEAEYNWRRVDELHKNSNATESEWTSVHAAFKRAEASVTAARAAHQLAQNNEELLPKRADENVAQAEAAEKLARARFNTTKTQLEKCVIRSPIDGIVLKRYLDVGMTVNATFQTPTLFLLSPPLDKMRVLAKVAESDIGHVSIGQLARFTINAKRPHTFEGRLIEKRSQPEVVQMVVTYTVVFEVDNDDEGTLLPGLTVNVEIECARRDSVVKIPNAALRFKPPLTHEDRTTRLDEAKWPPQPADASGRPPAYCSKASAWKFDESSRTWSVVPLWVGVTDNSDTEVLAGARPGEQFVKQYQEKAHSGFDLKDAIRQADPTQRKAM